MFSAIKKILAGPGAQGPDSREDREQKKHVAAGVLLLEAAHVDNDCSAAELAQIVATLKDMFALSEECIADLLALADKDRVESVDLWQFTNQVNQLFTQEEKLAVMEDVWRIVLLDGHLEQHEDQYAHKLANLLRLSHEQMIDAKLKARSR